MIQKLFSAYLIFYSSLAVSTKLGTCDAGLDVAKKFLTAWSSQKSPDPWVLNAENLDSYNSEDGFHVSTETIPLFKSCKEVGTDLIEFTFQHVYLGYFTQDTSGEGCHSYSRAEPKRLNETQTIRLQVRLHGKTWKVDIDPAKSSIETFLKGSVVKRFLKEQLSVAHCKNQTLKELSLLDLDLKNQK